MNLHESLISAGVSPQDLQEFKKIKNGVGLVDFLLQKKSLSEDVLLNILSSHFGLPIMRDLPLEEVETDFVEEVPIQYLRQYKILPLCRPQEKIMVVNDPSLSFPIDNLCRLLGWDDYRLVLATQGTINSAINLIYDRMRRSAEEFFQEISEESPEKIISEIEETGDLLADASEAPIIKLVNLLLTGAVRDRASDIHIEPYQSQVKVRYRIDGILYDVLSLPRRIHPPLTSRIKIMAKLNIAEKRLPQDGRIDIRIGDKSIDIRVSILPTAFGERVVLRLLDKTADLLKLADLGMTEKDVRLFHELIKSPYGIILVTGPTGSGKSTTLYAAISTINSPEINIITIEDPIEYQIEGVGQIQVNPKIDLTFANGLRSIVRQDPDVILVGEIRDRETAEIAIQSSLTGHLVFSTLHTNDAASAITRLIDMGIEPFLVTSSVIAIVAQRLVRILCPKCKEPYRPDEETLAKLNIGAEMGTDIIFYRKTGCLYCMNTGYRGRTGIFEILTMDEAIKKLVLTTSDANLINELAQKRGMNNLLHDGINKVWKGITTIEEVLRVTRVSQRDVNFFSPL
ncbi:MAG TPA: type II secretion system ATPase GspE [Syntrophales bacterium]|nr:type II secretion system ATPase GspE [Syntrophales bacterium]HOL58502.1 type II secretion system ATPase GspE [Syntrophales bacterium]HPO34890.1 type II secretion system ATPase GspE [Syntrophales bacterium]